VLRPHFAAGSSSVCFPHLRVFARGRARVGLHQLVVTDRLALAVNPQLTIAIPPETFLFLAHYVQHDDAMTRRDHAADIL